MTSSFVPDSLIYAFKYMCVYLFISQTIFYAHASLSCNKIYFIQIVIRPECNSISYI